MKESITSVKKSLIQINICVILLGGTALFAKLISLPADTITLFRSIFGCLSLLILILITRSFKCPSKKDCFLIIFTGLLTGVHWVTFFQAIQISTVAIGVLSLYTFPILTSFLEPIFDREKMKVQNIFLAMVVFMGILLIIPEFEISNQTTAGVILGLTSALLFSIRNIFVRKTLNHINGIPTMCYQLMVISIMFIPFVDFQPSLFVDNRLLLLILLGIVFTATPHVLLVASLRHLKATTASLILCLHPMYSIVFAAILISEIPSLKVILGGFIIVGISVYESIRVRQNAGS